MAWFHSCQPSYFYLTASSMKKDVLGALGHLPYHKGLVNIAKVELHRIEACIDKMLITIYTEKSDVYIILHNHGT